MAVSLSLAMKERSGELDTENPKNHQPWSPVEQEHVGYFCSGHFNEDPAKEWRGEGGEERLNKKNDV